LVKPSTAELRREAYPTGKEPPIGRMETRGSGPGGGSPVGPEVEAERLREMVRAATARKRQEMERVIEASTAAGYAIAQIGTFREQPRPIIEWTDDGSPVISSWTTAPKEST
jgi:hypothetical protein